MTRQRRGADRVDGGEIFAAQRLGARRGGTAPVAPAGHVAELEARHPQPGAGEGEGERLHPGRVHRRAGAVREEQGDGGVLGTVEEEDGHALRPPDRTMST